MGKNSRGKAEKQSSQANGKSSVAAGAAQNGKATAKRSRGNSAENKSEVPVKRQLFGSWTGKTPVSLLYEHCQKMGWQKPQFRTMKKAKGYQCLITIGKEDKKTKERTTFSWCPYGMFYEDDQLAKHFSATYTLHKVCSHMSIHRLLPPEPRALWQDLEEQRKKLDPSVVQYEFAADPFLAAETKAKEKEKATSEAAKASEKPKAPWENYPVVHMAAETRQVVEDLIRSHQTIVSERSPSSKQKNHPEDKRMLNTSLVKLGFRPAHVEEAIKFCPNYTTALEWLCVHVPEDDLPPRFLPEVSREINAERHTPESLAREYAVKRLCACGYSRQLCEAAIDESGGKEILALVWLTRRLTDGDTSHKHILDDAPDSSELEIIQDEESETSKAIFDTNFRSEKTESGTVLSLTFTLDGVPGHTTFEIHIPTLSVYPFETPAFVIRNDKLPAYIRLSLQRALALEALNLLGSPMIFALRTWLEDNMPGIVSTPPPLVSIAVGVMEGATPSLINGDRLNETRTATVNAAREKRVVRGLVEDRSQNVRLKKQLEEKQENPEFQKMLAYRRRLPSYKYRERIVEALAKSQVLIICGETGCGKSTQVGQFILDAMIESQKGSVCNIMVTQPRRISALALAERVAAERCEKVGESVGYSIRGESLRSAQTRLLFCTTGVLLRMIQSDPMLSGVSHIVIDEVHERGVDSDFLLIIVRDLLPKRPDFKLILMSATVNSETFSSYFSGAPVFEIAGFTHPVKDLYLEDVLGSVDYVPDWGKQGRGRRGQQTEEDSDEDREEREWKEKYETNGLNEGAVAALNASYKSDKGIDYSLLAAVVKYICRKEDEGAILIFMPGVMEIKKCIDTIRSEVPRDCGRMEILPLHANLSSKEQSSVFKKMVNGVRKVVVATNIAETSITIDDVVYVIDPGRVKEMRFNGSMLALTEAWASRASCKQRRGRAGRVRAGICYKLFSKRFEETKMPANSEPEMVRIPLEQLCLQVKAMGHDNVREFLGKAIDPPTLMNIENALKVLRDVNAVDTAQDRLTPLGRHMATIPADLRIAKILLFGAIFRCLSSALTIAACMSSKSPFVSPMNKRDEAREARERFATDKSDWLTNCRAFDAWSDVARKGRREERDFCERNFLSSTTLSAISDLRRTYLDTLIDLGYVDKGYRRSELYDLDVNSANGRVVKAVLLAGLYPNVARVKLPDVQYDQTAHGTVAIAAKAKEIKFYTREDGRVFIHPASINFSLNNFDGPLIVYHQKISTSKIFLRDTTICSPWPLLMFGGELRVEYEGRSITVSDAWKFQAFPRIAALVNGIRKILDDALEAKIADPGLDLGMRPVTQTMLKIITNDL